MALQSEVLQLAAAAQLRGALKVARRVPDQTAEWSRAVRASLPGAEVVKDGLLAAFIQLEHRSIGAVSATSQSSAVKISRLVPCQTPEGFCPAGWTTVMDDAETVQHRLSAAWVDLEHSTPTSCAPEFSGAVKIPRVILDQTCVGQIPVRLRPFEVVKYSESLRLR